MNDETAKWFSDGVTQQAVENIKKEHPDEAGKIDTDALAKAISMTLWEFGFLEDCD